MDNVGKEHRGGHVCVSLSLSIQGTLVRLKLSQDEIKKPCQYSRCAQKEEN